MGLWGDGSRSRASVVGYFAVSAIDDNALGKVVAMTEQMNSSRYILEILYNLLMNTGTERDSESF